VPGIFTLAGSLSLRGKLRLQEQYMHTSTVATTDAGQQAYYYVSPAKIVGKHLWRIVVKNGLLGRATEYQFRVSDNSTAPWKSHTEWPSYDFNDGTYLGLPKRLVRIYKAHESEIEEALKE
jgi:hypothetical protein